MAKIKIAVAMSGGVDSSVSALLLKQQGYKILGIYMKNWEYDIKDSNCPARKEYEEVKQVASKLGIEVQALNFVEEYKNSVFQHFLQDFQQGRTPNPDILCNKEIKFKVFLEAAKFFGADKIATGHYAKISNLDNKKKNKLVLAPPKDLLKNQTYFLYTLNQKQLAKTIFPLNNLRKEEVRQIALQNNLHNYNKKDSTGICFIGEQNFGKFIAKYLSPKAGSILDDRGNKVGEHQGLFRYTIGQRKGLHIGGMKNRAELPWYVYGKQLQKNILYITQDTKHPQLNSKYVEINNIDLVLNELPNIGTQHYCQIRYRQKKILCTLVDIRKPVKNQNMKNSDYQQKVCFNQYNLKFEFAELVYAVTPGQAFVFYTKDEKQYCLGGGTIKKSY